MDVDPNAYYYKALMWAGVDNHIVMGKAPDVFAPEDSMTRQDSVVMIDRYAEYSFRLQYPDVSWPSIIYPEYPSCYVDTDQVSPYANNAMRLAIGYILMGKTPTTIAPRDFATRAETVMMLYRYLT